MTRVAAGSVPPSDPDAEAAVLGAMLLTRPAVRQAAATLRADDFHDPVNRRIFEAILAVSQRGDPVDVLTVGAALGEGDWKRVLARRLAACPVAAHAETYARLVAERAQERRLVGLADQLRTAPDRSARLVLARRLGEEAARTPGGRRHLVDGATFVLDPPAGVPALWGSPAGVAWAAGETLMVVGPPGLGKSTLAQQLVLARLGLRASVLGWPVVPEPGRVLYLAADRPEQISRSIRRMVSEADRPILEERLAVWQGPLPEDLGARPALLRDMAREHGAGTVVLDSLKDVALDLVKDEVGSRVNHALQLALADGVQVLALHHQRKHSVDGTKPTGLADVYGSAWITAGAGSVILLSGRPGVTHVELTHLKQPAGDVGPVRLVHDHARGVTRVDVDIDVGSDALAILRSSPRLTARGLAEALSGMETPDRNQVERARRRLDALVKGGLALCIEGHKGGAGGGSPTVYVAACDESDDHVTDHAQSRDPGDHAAISVRINGTVATDRGDHDGDHADHATPAYTSPSP